MDKLTVKLQFGKYHYVVEADIKGSLTTSITTGCSGCWQERIDDRALLRLIRKWLKAGVLDTDGEVIHPATGTPQGGMVSPILANVYLHYVLDLWFQEVVKKHCRGEACLIRYADDFVCAFEYQEDAERFYRALGQRLRNSGWTWQPRRHGMIPFDTDTEARTALIFWGLSFAGGRIASGKPHLKRRTSRRNCGTRWPTSPNGAGRIGTAPSQTRSSKLKPKLRGYYNYYGVSGNYARPAKQFFGQAMGILRKWLNRRSQRRSFTWQGFEELIEHFQVPRPRIPATSEPERQLRWSEP